MGLFNKFKKKEKDDWNVEYVNGQAACIAPDDPLNAARSPA